MTADPQRPHVAGEAVAGTDVGVRVAVEQLRPQVAPELLVRQPARPQLVGAVQPGIRPPSLATCGVNVRDRSKAPFSDGCIRVTAGIVEHTDAAIDALEAAVVSGLATVRSAT